MTFQDIFKSKFLENVTAIPPLDMFLGIFISFLIGLFIFSIYKKTYPGIMYSAGFGVTLISITMITNLIIMAVTSNIVLSLGMVGALSIVRFRTAIKEPLDLVFLFWSVAVGIVVAAGFIPLAVFGSFFIGLIMYVFANWKTYDNPYILVLNCESEEKEEIAIDILKNSVKKIRLKSKSVQSGLIELNFEIRLKDDDTSFLNTLSEIDGVLNTILVSYDGDYLG